MGKRRAVGATLVSVILFSSLILSNAAILASAQEKASAASLADGESSLSAGAVTLQGVAGLELLASAQTALSSRAFQCVNATGEAHRAVGGLSASVASDGTSSTAVASLGAGDSRPDNLSLLRGFDGGLPGRFDVAVKTMVNGSYPGGRVTYSKDEVHVLNLPFDPSTAGSFCLAALGELASSLGFLSAGTCNASQIAAAVSGAEARIRAAAGPLGLKAYVTYAIDGGASCFVTVDVRVAQGGIAGPDGPFIWTVEEAERLP